jgi:excisionase family DNA binding protein
LTIGEASEYLGISKLTLYGWVSARKLGFVKVGRLVKFKQEHLDRWIDQHTIKVRPAAQECVEDRSESTDSSGIALASSYRQIGRERWD